MAESKESSGVAHNGIDDGSLSNNPTDAGQTNAIVNVERNVLPPHDRFLPIANVSRIMKKALPGNAKISKEAKETVQECVSEFVSYITGEASDKCRHEKRKTINGDDLLWSMNRLDFTAFVPPLKVYLQKFREYEGEKSNNSSSQQQQQTQQQQQSTQNRQVRVDPNGANSSGVDLGVGNYSDYGNFVPMGRKSSDNGNSIVDPIAAQYTYPIEEGGCSISNLGNETQYGKVEPFHLGGFDPNILYSNAERENCKGKRVLTDLEGLESGEILHNLMSQQPQPTHNKRMCVDDHIGASSSGADLKAINYSNYGNVVSSRRSYSDYGNSYNGMVEFASSQYTSPVIEGGSSISNLRKETQGGKVESSHCDGFDPYIFHRNAESENGRGKRVLTNAEGLDSGEILHNLSSLQPQPTMHDKGMCVDPNGASSSGADFGAINYGNYGNVVPSIRNYNDYGNVYNGMVDSNASQHAFRVGEDGSSISNLGNKTQNDKAESSHYDGLDPKI